MPKIVQYVLCKKCGQSVGLYINGIVVRHKNQEKTSCPAESNSRRKIHLTVFGEKGRNTNRNGGRSSAILPAPESHSKVSGRGYSHTSLVSEEGKQ